jgi:Uma2 family endonuclease
VRFNVDDVLAMLRQGILHEDATTELLNGLIVLKDRSDVGENPRMHGPKHRPCVRLLTKLAAVIDNDNRHVQIQLPVVCGDDQMPEPDFAVIRGADRDYTDKLPRAEDAFCVLEVADSSWERDVGEKLPIYAAAGISDYIILKLRNRTADEYTAPDTANAKYATNMVIPETGMLSLRVGLDESVPIRLADILP